MKLHIKTKWHPWFHQGEAGGFVQVYKGDLTLATVRGAGHQVVKPAPTVTSQVLKRKRRASIASFQSYSSSSAMTTPINQSGAAPRMRNDNVMGRKSFVWDPQRMCRTSRVKSPLGQSNEAALSSHAVEAAPVAAPRSNKFMGSPE
nr:kinesin-like protein KIFC3 [Tanacetum cinerariifolium]